MTAAATTALLGTFSYLAVMLVVTTGLDAGWVPLVLFGYGLGAVVSIAAGGRAADHIPRAILGIGFIGLFVVSLLLSVSAHHAELTVALVAILGSPGFGTDPALNTRFIGFVPGAPTLAVTGNVSAFNVGITLALGSVGWRWPPGATTWRSYSSAR